MTQCHNHFSVFLFLFSFSFFSLFLSSPPHLSTSFPLLLSSSSYSSSTSSSSFLLLTVRQGLGRNAAYPNPLVLSPIHRELSRTPQRLFLAGITNQGTQNSSCLQL